MLEQSGNSHGSGRQVVGEPEDVVVGTPDRSRIGKLRREH